MQSYVIQYPPSIEKELKDFDIHLYNLFSHGDYDSAISLFEEKYAKVRLIEDELDREFKFHKGGLLHNWGISLIRTQDQKRISSGIDKVVLAFIEDLYDFDHFDEAYSSPAYTFLKQFTQAIPLFNLIEEKIAEIIKSGTVIKDPQEIYNMAIPEFLEEKDSMSQTLEDARKKIREFVDSAGEKRKRVFIGGAYKNIAVLKHIADTVEKFGFIPIMACDCQELSEPPFDQHINETSILLLEECQHAIFEITFSNGHLMEIERAKDHIDLKVMLVYQIMKGDDPPRVTRMVITTTFEKFGYQNFTQLTAKIGEFLH